MKNKELEKAKVEAVSNTNLMEQKIDSGDMKKDEFMELASKMRKSNADATNDIKLQTQLLQEKLSKSKKEVNLKIEEDFKTEYLAPPKDIQNSEAQCEIWEKPDFNTLYTEKVEQKNKKKPISVSIIL